MEEAGDLLEDSWFFKNLLHTKTRTMSRCYSDLTSTSCPPPLCSTQEHVVKNEGKNSSFSSRKQPHIAPLSLTRTQFLPTSKETQSFLTKKPIPHPNLTRASSISTSIVVSDQENHMIVKNEKKSSSFSSRKQPPIAPPSLIRTPPLPTSIETRTFLTKNRIPRPHLTRTSSMSTMVVRSDQEDEEDDQESEFTLGRLIRQASMNSSHTLNPPRQTAKLAITENQLKKPESDEEKISDMGRMERNISKGTKNTGKNKGGGGAPAIPGGWVDKSSSEDMKAHIKVWARAVASNVRQECS